MNIQIALDGPSGSGKSTMARRLAEEFGLYYIDTGALYRAVGIHMMNKNANVENSKAIDDALQDAHISFDFIENSQHVYIAGEDVTGRIRTQEVASLASQFSAVPAVRAYLLKLQRDFAGSNRVIMDGRDIGTVILPNAPIKIFLTAEPEIRAHRRWLQLREAGIERDEELVLAEVLERDARDTSREVAPLKKAPDAKIIDSTELDIEGTYRALCEYINMRINEIEGKR